MSLRRRALFCVLLVYYFFSSGNANAQTYLGNFTSYSKEGKSVIVRMGNSGLRFVFYKPNIVRVDCMPALATKFDSSVVIVQDTLEQVNFAVIDNDSVLSLLTSDLRIVCLKYPLRVAYYSADGTLLVKEPAQGGYSYNESERTVNFSVQADEHYYGTGERGMSLDLRGRAFDSFNEQHGGYTSPPARTMNVNIPFFVSSRKYGIYFDDTYEGHFDIDSSRTNVLTYTACGGELSYFFICDSSMKGVVSSYTWLTGRAPLLPKWSYGYIQSKFGYHDPMAVRDMTQRMRSDGIPCDAFVLDLYWFKHMGDLAWDETRWPDPANMTADFLKTGFKTIVISEPYVMANSLNFDEGIRNGYFAKDSIGNYFAITNWWSSGYDAGVIDVTNPAARNWWYAKCYSIFKSGVAGLWTDLGEPERDYPEMRFDMGPDLKIHNIYNFLWAQLIFDGYNKSFPNRRMFNLTRAGYAGIQRFNAVNWSGDVSKTFGGLAVQLPFLLNMGMSGITYQNSDIGGFGSGKTTPELYARWMEFGAFCPVMRAHGYEGDNQTEPWAFGPETERIVKKMIELRYASFPYNYTIAHNAYVTGIPMARALVMEYPNNPGLSCDCASYMWGDDFLVAPVVAANQTVQSFYLPKGKWINYWSDEVYEGGDTISVPAPIDEIPLFVKSGSIIPMQPVPSFLDDHSPDTIMLAIYPDRNFISRGVLYEDDGLTLDYQHGAYATTAFDQTMDSTDGSVNMTINIGTSEGKYNGKPMHRTYICEIHKIEGPPIEVLSDNSSVPMLESNRALDIHDSGWIYDISSRTLFVKIFASADNAHVIKVSGLASGERK